AQALTARSVREMPPGEPADDVMACVERPLDTNRLNAIDYEIEINGALRVKESRMVPSGDGSVVTIVRDFTEQRRAEGEQLRLAEEQAALRRVATLVASDAPPERGFQTVTE